MSFLQDIPGGACCPVITMFLFPDMEPDPAIDSQARLSNFHVLWGTDKLADRLDEAAADSGYRPSTSEPYGPGGVPGGLRRRGWDQLFSTTGKPNPHCPVIRTQWTPPPPEAVANRPLKSSPDHPERTPPMKPHRLHPYPRSPTTLGGPAPQDRACGDTNPTELN